MIDAPDGAHSIRTQRAWTGLFLILAVVIPLLYIGISHQIWEDYFITFRHSRNFVEGKGLVFNPGERVQGFTSAINVMLPALFYWLTGKHGYEAALNGYRAISLIAFVLGGFLLLRLMLRDRGGDRLSPLLFTLFFVTDAKAVGFTMNGQECGFMIAFLALGLAAAYWGMARPWWIAGVAWAGLLYTRPDSPIYIGALVITTLVFRRDNLRAILLALLKAAILAAVIYLPWFISVWLYYGSPIPHTAVAKPAFTLQQILNPAGLLRMTLQNYPQVAAWIFQPAYTLHGGWPMWLVDSFAMICAIVACGFCFLRSADRLGRMASLMFVLSTAYLSLVNVGAFAQPWYLPSASIFGTVVLARAIPEFCTRLIGAPRPAHMAARGLQCALLAVSFLLLIAVTVQMRIHQQVIEEQHRVLVGLYLGENMKPTETAYMEPLGYIGYFSDRNIRDWPGLVAPEVVRFRRAGANQVSMIVELMPDWLVLRPAEVNAAALLPQIRQHYRIDKTFDARPSLEQYSYIPGKGYLEFDDLLYVLRRLPSAPSTSPSTSPSSSP